MAISREQFVDCLGKSGLMSATEVAALQSTLPAEKAAGDGTFVASELVKLKKLTPYQAAILSQGQFKGLVFGDYKVLDKLGEGGMGLVFKAQHRHLKRVVALKVLHPAVTQSEDAVRRFHREVEAVARLAHPNIITAYDASVQEGTYFLAMEFVDGIDLGRLVKEKGPLPVDRAVHYLAQAARGLEYTHKMGVVHRDIKPSNLLLEHTADPQTLGFIKILDMGLVRFTDVPTMEGSTAGPDGLTQTGDIMGSFDYIAPEQAIDTKRADGRADIYSLGCTLYFVLTGKPPYTGDTSMQKLLAHRENAIPSLRKARPEVPLALDAVFHRMVAKKAEDRYPSMTEVLVDLDACRVPRGDPVEKVGKAPLTGSRSTPGMSILLCGTLCILAVVAGNVFLAYEAAGREHWDIPENVWLGERLALAAGIGMAAIGGVMIVVSSLVARWLRMAQRSPTPSDGSSWLRRLLGGLAGVIVGAIGGGAIGGSLAMNSEYRVRLGGAIGVGIFVGAALGGRRSWLVILGCALAGYFVGTEIGVRGVSLESLGLDLQLPPDSVAVLGFAIVGAIVGAVLGAERRSPSALKKGTGSPTQSVAKAAAATEDDPVGDKTVRRLTGRS